MSRRVFGWTLVALADLAAGVFGACLVAGSWTAVLWSGLVVGALFAYMVLRCYVMRLP